MKGESATEMLKPNYYPACNKPDDYNMKCFDAFCSGLIIILIPFFFSLKSYCKESMYSMFEIKKLFP